MTTSWPPSQPDLPIPIFRTSEAIERYLLYDIDHITYLRATYHILGVLIGTLPQIPQQSVFLGLPLQLQPEEARLLVDKGVAYVVDDRKRHDGDFRQRCGAERDEILSRLRKEGLEIARDIERKKAGRTKEALASRRKQAARASRRAEGDLESDDDTEETLFEDTTPQQSKRSSSTSNSNLQSWAITPTFSEPIPSPPKSSVKELIPVVEAASYALFAHLHSHDYYITPGLRFGCQFSVYPGDPLRFHSHFLANAYDWEEEINLLDLIGGGRLGTGVKKGWLVGGREPAPDELTRKPGDGGSEGRVRTFCIEWGGM